MNTMVSAVSLGTAAAVAAPLPIAALTNPDAGLMNLEPIAPSTPSSHPSDDLLVATLRRPQDVDLIELGKKFEPLLDRYYIAQRRWSSARRRRAADVLHVIHDEMKPLANAINAASVTSIEGLRVKALVALWEIEPLCKGDTEFSFDDAYPFQQLFTAVAEACGLKDKIAATGCTLPDIGVAWNECDEDFEEEEDA